MGDDYDGLDDKLLDNDDDSPHYLEENELNQSNEQSTRRQSYCSCGILFINLCNMKLHAQYTIL